MKVVQLCAFAALPAMAAASVRTVPLPDASLTEIAAGAGEEVVLEVASDASIVLGLDGGGAVVRKTGSGVLTVVARPGRNSGEFVVADGRAVLAGNGGGAPGAFDKITVAQGASAVVSASPAATRHGVLRRFGASKSGAYDDDDYSYRDKFDGGFSAYETEWADMPAVDSAASDVFVPGDGDAAHLRKGAMTPAAFAGTASPFYVLTRTLLLGETGGSLWWQSYGSASHGVAIVDGGAFRLKTGGWWGERGWRELSAGWHSLDTAIEIEKSAFDFHVWKRTAEGAEAGAVRRDDGWFSGDVTWCGVAANSVAVESGGTLEIADGHAFAVADAAASDFSGGVVAGGSASCLALLCGESDSAMSALAGFAGTVETGRAATLRLPPSAASAAYSISGRGVVVVASDAWARFADGFDGEAVAASGSALPPPPSSRFGASFEFTAESGVTLLPADGDEFPVSLLNSAAKIALPQSGSFTIGVDELAEAAGGDLRTVAVVDETAAFASDAWTLSSAGDEYAGSSIDADGKLVLSPLDADRHCLGKAVMNGSVPAMRPFTATFTLSPSWTSWTAAEGFSFTAQTGGPGAAANFHSWDQNKTLQESWPAKPSAAWGVYAKLYSGDDWLDWIDANERLSGDGARVGKHAMASGKRYRFTLSHDGAGRMEASFSDEDGGNALSAVRTMTDLDFDADFNLAFMCGINKNLPASLVVDSFGLKVAPDDGAGLSVAPEIAVAQGAESTLVLGSASRGTTKENAIRLGTVSLGGGSALALSPEGGCFRAEIGILAVGESGGADGAALRVAKGGALGIGAVSLLAAKPLAVSGEGTLDVDSLDVIVSEAALLPALPATLADFSGAAFASGEPPAVRLLGESGTELRRVAAAWRNGVLFARAKSGLRIVVR